MAALVSITWVNLSANKGLGNTGLTADKATEPMRRVNAPHFDGEVRFAETAILWFGQVDSTNNYADVRVGYNDEELYVHVAVFDRWLWYDTNPSPDELTDWDAITLYLHLDGNDGDTLDSDVYRFVGQLNWWEEREPFQTAYHGDGSAWVHATTPFTTTSSWRGHAPNHNDGDDRGWTLVFRIPFESVGSASPPARGSVWGMALALHDRDDEAGTPVPDATWPEKMDGHLPSTYGRLAFGVPTYSPPPTAGDETVVIRHKLNGVVVQDAAVGGTTGNLCPADTDYLWNEWGHDNFAGTSDFNIQNQRDVADWPCFAKYYVTFPLSQVPHGQTIISATLTLHQFGNSGGGSWGAAKPSLIQVLTVADDWEETTLTWNSAPLATENVAAAWVNPISSSPGWPGLARNWNVSRAAAQAYGAGEPLRLVLYAADAAYHSGKYFVSSHTGDWNAEGRPTLTVVWGEPVATLRKEVWPVVAAQSQMVTYTLSLLGDGEALTLTDTLPAQVSAPSQIEVSGGAAPHYDVSTHRLIWSDSPGLGHAVTITLPVTVQVARPGAVANTATLIDTKGRVSRDRAVFVVRGHLLFLPLTLRSP